MYYFIVVMVSHVYTYIKTLLSPGAWSYPPLSSFLVTPFFEAGMIKVANGKLSEDIPTATPAPTTVRGIITQQVAGA